MVLWVKPVEDPTEVRSDWHGCGGAADVDGRARAAGKTGQAGRSVTLYLDRPSRRLMRVVDVEHRHDVLHAVAVGHQPWWITSRRSTAAPTPVGVDVVCQVSHSCG